MCRIAKTIALLACLILPPGVRAQAPASLPVPLPTESLSDFSKLLKDVLVQTLPPVLNHESNRNWGQQASVPTLQGVKVVRVVRNHGNWLKLRATTTAHALELKVRDLQAANGESFKFKIFLAVPTTVEYEQQTWQNGLKVFASHARARLRIKLDLSLETSIKTDPKGGLLPDVIIDYKVADARVSYDNFVLENVNGVGGDAARLAGEAARVVLRRWLPAVEQHALDKGREAVLKAGQTREVRISLARLVQLPSFKAAK